MRVREAWLRSWIDPPCDLNALCHTLTMLGLEVSAIEENDAKEGIFEIDLTPNRGDCASILGLARELSAAYEMPYHAPKIKAPTLTKRARLMPIKVSIEKAAVAACPYYCAAVLTEVNAGVKTPPWMCAALEAAGITQHHLIVDVLNVVMLELGQPLHAFDSKGIEGALSVAFAKKTDLPFIALGGEQLVLQEKTLVVKDDSGAVAIAGILGGQALAVTPKTTQIFIESAWFTKEAIRGKARQYGLHTESAYRFERGVDPHMVLRALDRACQLIVSIGGGALVQRIEHGATCLAYPEKIKFDPSLVNRRLGTQVLDVHIAKVLKRLQCRVDTKNKHLWCVEVPSYRQDLHIAEDLVEEYARSLGLDKIKARIPVSPLKLAQNTMLKRARLLKRLCGAEGLQEVVNYSFVDAVVQSMLSNEHALALAHPIAENRSVMRTTLWTGLIETLAYHQNRQYARVRLCETGVCFIGKNECAMVAGIVTGTRFLEQWHVAKASTDFFDLKKMVAALVGGMGHGAAFSTVPLQDDPALHPGMAAQILLGQVPIGRMGALHPSVVLALKLQGPVWVFELQEAPLLQKVRRNIVPVSKFPSVRRDLALLVPEHMSAAQVLAAISSGDTEKDWTLEQFVFDVYHGKGLAEGFRSMGVGLIFQRTSGTLVDTVVDAQVQRILAFLKEHLGVVLR